MTNFFFVLSNLFAQIFGEAVLGLSQGSVSELLSKPKPWHMLSIKGREPFIRMQLWLSDANNVERLQVLKNERREASKRRRSIGPGAQDNSSDTSSNDTSEFYTSNSPGPGSVGSAGAPPNKKQRVLFSEEQKEALRLAFALDPYPNVQTIEFLASELSLSTRTITNWFHNHRMRLKQQVPHGTPSEPVPSRENTSGAPFDPVQFRILLNQRLIELQKERMGMSGVPLPYPPYFAANPNLAALIGRGLLPTNEAELAALNNAFREQMSGLDLSMGSLKRERDDFFDDDDNDSHASDGEDDDNHDDMKSESNPELSAVALAIQTAVRASRRKPAAPQWVNPAASRLPLEDELIINGVCVMQQNPEFDRAEEDNDDTVRIEPQAVKERFGNENIDQSDDENDDDKTSPRASPKRSKSPEPATIDNSDKVKPIGENVDDDEESGTKDDAAADDADSPVVKKEVDDGEQRWDF